MGSCAKAMQVDPAVRPGLPWLATDNESETEPEDLYSQGDRPDPHKDRWERAVGGVVVGIRHLVSPPGTLVGEIDCCEEGTADCSRPVWRDKTTPSPVPSGLRWCQ